MVRKRVPTGCADALLLYHNHLPTKVHVQAKEKQKEKGESLHVGCY